MDEKRAKVSYIYTPHARKKGNYGVDIQVYNREWGEEDWIIVYNPFEVKKWKHEWDIKTKTKEWQNQQESVGKSQKKNIWRNAGANGIGCLNLSAETLVR